MWSSPLALPVARFLSSAIENGDAAGILPDWPPAVWALLGVIVTAVGAFVREFLKSRSSPYSDMVGRLSEIEEQASRVPKLEAQVWLLHTWGVSMIGWAEQVVTHTAEHDIAVPHPPPTPPIFDEVDRRVLDIGPPLFERRADHDGPT